MSFEDTSTYYEVLEIQPDASLKEVQSAYHRAKAAYTRDSVALYTLISPEERETTLKRIEEAFSVLSNSERRAEYDKCHGHLNLEDHQKVVSIDRVPPMSMDSGLSTDHLLVPPATDFIASASPPPGPLTAQNPLTTGTPSHSPTALLLEEQLAQEVIWPGSLIKRVRETKGISIEEMASVTKISKTNIHAIEDENYSKFPAPVYLRGFVMQISKVLKLPHEKVAAAYLARYFQAKPDSKT